MKRSIKFLILVCFLLGINASAFAERQSTFSNSPEVVKNGLDEKAHTVRQAELFSSLSADFPRDIDNAPVTVTLTEEERSELAKPQPRGGVPLRVGLVKSIPTLISIAGLADGQPNAGVIRQTKGGGLIWAASIKSPEAQALRLHFVDFSLPDGVKLYVFSRGGDVRGPYEAKGPNGDGDFWTGAIFSERISVVVKFQTLPTKEDLKKVKFTLSDLGYIGRNFLNSKELSEWSSGQCGNEDCVIDANCADLGPAANAARAVAKMEWIAGFYIYSCTGGLIADTNDSTQEKLFLTANHCLSTSNSTLETYFNYTTDVCNGTCPVNPAPYTTGATVLATGADADFTLLKLGNGGLPIGAVFLGWNASAIAFSNGANLYRVSNPNFGPQVYSHHQVSTTAATCWEWPRGDRIYSRDIDGAIDGGSSGSPVVNANGEVVGQLSGCCGYNCNDVCDSVSNATVDGALAAYYSQVADFLDPSTGGCTANAECDDGLFCNGAELCVSGDCQPGSNPCVGQACDESLNVCTGCTLKAKGESCTTNAECCSGRCKGKKGRKTCA